MLLNKIKWACVRWLVATGLVFTSAAVLGQPQTVPCAAQKETEDAAPAPAEPSGENGPAAKPSAPPLQDFAKTAGPARRPAPKQYVSIEGGAIGGPVDRADDPRSRMILKKLDEPISMSFANETPLEDVLKYIKQATTSKTYNGIPIYVDPYGLQEAERSLNSTISIDLDGVPLRRTLQLILTQLKLAYFVEDGILVITSGNSAAQAHLPPSMAGPSPFMEKQEKAERGELSLSEMQELIELVKLQDQLIQLSAVKTGIPLKEARRSRTPTR